MAGSHFLINRPGRFTALLLIALAVSFARPILAGDAFVILSGGDSPMENNYSQYLQARAMAAYFETAYPTNSVWVFFGAGNVEGEKPFFSDVYHEIKRDGLLVDSWLPGAIPRNHPARHDAFLRALREEILPVVAPGGTLYLFVGDHGSRTRGRNPESIISLWGMHPDPDGEHGWSYDENESLSVSELRRTLAAGIGKGRVVFCMTQCHSGGFHYLAVPHQMQPNPAWFTRVPDWAGRRDTTAPLLIAGFTATDEYSLASGCDPSPDPDQWAGYERYLPENLLGVNLFTLQHTNRAMRSFAEAHAAAVLADPTIDKPASTSEQYLERWSNLIETRLAREPALTARVKRAVTAYQRTVDGATPKVSDASFKERQTLFHGFVTRMTEENSDAKNLLLTGTRRQLEAAASSSDDGMAGMNMTPTTRQPGRRGGRRGGGTSQPERRRLWNDTVRPAWAKAVEARQATTLPAAARDFEKHLLMKEDEGASYFFGGTDSLRDELFWQTGYGTPQTLDTVKAEASALWVVQRRAKILDWAKTSEDPDVQDAARRLAQTNRPAAAVAMDDSERTLSKATAAERALFYRRVLAAWEFLIAVNEKPALVRVRELTQLERTPLPPVK